jgi:hypothetical protein
MSAETEYARIKAMRSPETLAAQEAWIGYQSLNPDPRDPDHWPTVRRLKTAYEKAAKEDGSFYASLASAMDNAAEKNEGYAAKHSDSGYLETAAKFRGYAQDARNELSAILAARASGAEVSK